ncbi:hypothetical protein MACH09_34860 [Vibrio sp. MACH09]|uniref:YdaS family helix-turn-helix protein n=1 Tax=Vibrio sp. MACH09 TaxID=3025122 RepID=UPI002794E0B9|nr:YdaS family helix-turn-helix protein [Vibrio sp. MACH09]GLO62978.1 hypothetical protein MACH09_34860 [Vibrio sp. MACH09]
MIALRNYLKTLPSDEKHEFSDKCGTTTNYLRKAVSINQLLNPIVCSLIETHSCGAVTREQLRPDDWHIIWPELKGRTSIN